MKKEKLLKRGLASLLAVVLAVGLLPMMPGNMATVKAADGDKTVSLGTDVIKQVKFNDESTIDCDGVFIYYGYQADTAFMKDLNITDDKGYIEVDNSMRTKVPFIYACGDIIKKDVYQIVTAASDGCIAALSLKKDINKSEK